MLELANIIKLQRQKVSVALIRKGDFNADSDSVIEIEALKSELKRNEMIRASIENSFESAKRQRKTLANILIKMFDTLQDRLHQAIGELKKQNGEGLGQSREVERLKKTEAKPAPAKEKSIDLSTKTRSNPKKNPTVGQSSATHKYVQKKLDLLSPRENFKSFQDRRQSMGEADLAHRRRRSNLASQNKDSSVSNRNISSDKPLEGSAELGPYRSLFKSRDKQLGNNLFTLASNQPKKKPRPEEAKPKPPEATKCQSLRSPVSHLDKKPRLNSPSSRLEIARIMSYRTKQVKQEKESDSVHLGLSKDSCTKPPSNKSSSKKSRPNSIKIKPRPETNLRSRPDQDASAHLDSKNYNLDQLNLISGLTELNPSADAASAFNCARRLTFDDASPLRSQSPGTRQLPLALLQKPPKQSAPPRNDPSPTRRELLPRIYNLNASSQLRDRLPPLASPIGGPEQLCPSQQRVELSASGEHVATSQFFSKRKTKSSERATDV